MEFKANNGRKDYEFHVSAYTFIAKYSLSSCQNPIPQYEKQKIHSHPRGSKDLSELLQTFL